MSAHETSIQRNYEVAKERYAQLGVDTDAAMHRARAIPISVHCWQGDDVGGFEVDGTELSGGIAVTGAYPGKARNVDELRRDIEKTFSLIPGRHRFSLHAMYGEFAGAKVDRDQVEPRHFQGWIDWAKSQNVGLRRHLGTERRSRNNCAEAADFAEH